jgi:hypothetical protein
MRYQTQPSEARTIRHALPHGASWGRRSDVVSGIDQGQLLFGRTYEVLPKYTTASTELHTRHVRSRNITTIIVPQVVRHPNSAERLLMGGEFLAICVMLGDRIVPPQKMNLAPRQPIGSFVCSSEYQTPKDSSVSQVYRLAGQY